MTIGIVRVAFFTARAAVPVEVTMTFRLEANHRVGESRESLDAILPIPALDHNVPTLDPTVVVQSLKEGFLAGIRRRGSITPQVADPSNLSRQLLRLGGKAKRKEHTAQ